MCFGARDHNIYGRIEQNILLFSLIQILLCPNCTLLHFQQIMVLLLLFVVYMCGYLLLV